ncbi:hypothetical protein NLX83_14050 [Allokutzneria sp. A3M-2-11 16]|uniref:hypothetical protein n=1 Tax=Allokutzneria sp. A3M-2-11 16 TaxID=2962043 RepID=UPI0020B70088|nr:hypothetical protein [Allokutzneria sp. A3M-2-11 16]MCP3800383.1 hypothetical protein [Allokutzneria sp. A3M-2-11 16]
MEFLRLVLVFLHLLGMAVLVAMLLLQRRTAPDGPLNKGWLHGSLLQLVTGLALVGIAEMGEPPVNHAKVGVKLVVLLVILGLVAVNVRKEKFAGWLVPTLAALVVLNTGVAVFWV